MRRLLFDFLLLPQQALALGRKEADLVQHYCNVLALLFQEKSALPKLGEECCQLSFFTFQIIEFKQLPDLIEWESQPLAAQGELETASITIAEYARGALARGANQSLFFIMPDRARGEGKLLRQVTDRVGGPHCAMQYKPVR